MSFDLMFRKATDFYLNGAYTQAEEICRQILAFAPENPDVLNMLGLIAAAKNEHQAAISCFYEALKKSTNPLPVYFNLAVSLNAFGKQKEALEAYQNALKLAPQTKEIYNNMGAIYEKLGHFEKAAENYEKAVQIDSDYVDAGVNLAVIKKDKSALLNLTEKYPKSPLPVYYLALFAFDEANFNQALKFALKADALQQAYDIKNLIAQCYLKIKENNEAEKYFHQALVLYPQSVDALINLGILEQNEAYFKKALDLNPSSFEAHISYADFLYRENRRVEALEEYHQAVLLNADAPAVSNNVALVLKDMQDYEGALDLLLNAFLKTPENNDISVNIAETLVLLFQKQKNEALKIAKLWQKNAPNNVFAAHTLSAFENKPSSNDALYAKTLFDEFATLYDKRMGQIDYQTLDKLISLKLDLKGDILDLGCGTGLAPEKLKTPENSWTGIDISKNMLEKAKQKNLYDNLLESDILSFLETNTKKYDFILCLDVLPYIQNIETLIEKCFPSNLIFSIEKAPDNQKSIFLAPEGRYQHNPQHVENLLKKAGYRNILPHHLILRKENGKNIDGVLFVATAKQ